MVRMPIIFLISTRDRLPTIRTAWSHMITITVAVVGASIVFLIGTSNRLPTIRTTRRLIDQIASIMIRFSIDNLELLLKQRATTTSTEKVLWVPTGAQSIDVVPPHTLPTILTQRHAFRSFVHKRLIFRPSCS